MGVSIPPVSEEAVDPTQFFNAPTTEGGTVRVGARGVERSFWERKATLMNQCPLLVPRFRPPHHVPRSHQQKEDFATGDHERNCFSRLLKRDLNSFLLLVVRPGAPSSVLAPSSDARSA